MTRVAVLQSNYIPWKGYFDIINDVDLFVFYDDVQFTKNDWRNRNVIKTKNGPLWLTVPVGQKISRLICEVKVTNSTWQKTHWESLKQNYSKARFFNLYKEFFQTFYLGTTWESLSELNQFLIKQISVFLGIKTRFADSLDYTLEGQNQERLLSLLQQVKASYYLSGPAGRNYMDDDLFRQSGIEVAYKSYDHYKPYPQFHGEFDHRVSILDLLFHCGPDSGQHIWNQINAVSVSNFVEDRSQPLPLQ